MCVPLSEEMFYNGREMESGKHEIESLLQKACTGSLDNIWPIFSKIHFYMSIHLPDAPPISLSRFRILIDKLNCEQEHNWYNAFESFWTALQNQDTNTPENIAQLKKAASKSKKHPGVKCVRSLFWGEFNLLSDILDKQDDTTRYLLSEKMYRRSQNTDGDDLGYIFDAYGIPEDMRSVNELRMYVESINQLLEIDIEILEGYLQRIPELETQKPQVLKWVVGYMGHHISKYLPNWESYNQERNRRKKPYKQQREKLVRFLNGETYKELGYTTNTWHNFNETGGPKGIAGLLIEAYDILHGQNAAREVREKMIEEMSQKVRDVFKERDSDKEEKYYLYPEVITYLYYKDILGIPYEEKSKNPRDAFGLLKK